MTSDNYSPYSYPYQQSTPQQFPTYQTTAGSNNLAQSSRQHGLPPRSQAQDYITYQSQSYASQGTEYSRGQDHSWSSSSYAAPRETTSRAAEVLHNMSNTAYTPNSTLAANQSSYTTTNNPASLSPQMQSQSQSQSQATHSSYGQSQARPRSTNTNRPQGVSNRALPSPAVTVAYHSQRQAPYASQQQRTASPVQHQYNAGPATSARTTATTTAVHHQHNDYSQREPPGIEANANRAPRNTAVAPSYNYDNPPNAAPASTTSVADTYSSQGAATVDPMAVYDPWPEYQRKQEALRAQKAAEDAERERIAEQRRLEEEERTKQQEEEQKRKEVEEQRRQPQPPTKKTQYQGPSVPEGQCTALDPSKILESEIRAVMAKMRELNGKDPALLARIWEEERRAKGPRSPTVQSTSTAQTAVPQPSQASKPSTPAPTSQQSAVHRAPVHANIAKLVTAAPAQPTQPQAQPVVNRSSGNTIWPPEKKEHLANAAVAYLNERNPNKPLEPRQILGMLNTNPSYIELCEQLEHTGVSLDRAAFAKNLLNAVPEVNSSARKTAPQVMPVVVQRSQVPPAVMKKEVVSSVPREPQHTQGSIAPANSEVNQTPSNNGPPSTGPIQVAEMVPIKAELKGPANKEEAARKRNLSELVDLTLLSDEEDLELPAKRQNTTYSAFSGPADLHTQSADVSSQGATINNFPIANAVSQPPRVSVPSTAQAPINELRHKHCVDQLDKKKALRRNSYNPATIARDVLLACGRHPTERQLNQHLDLLRTTLPQVSYDSDLSTIRWDLIDPGNPPPGYFKDSVQGLAEDADDEEDSDDEIARPRAPSSAIGGEGGAQARVQALPQPSNPFKKRRGRPPRHSLPNPTFLSTPQRVSSPAGMSVSAPRSSSATSGVGYNAFRSATEYGPDGLPLPKKRGRPVGWRKAIHGSAAAQSRLTNGHTNDSQPSTLRTTEFNSDEPIPITSRSPSVVARGSHYQSYKCKWQDCKAELHNLETLQKHVIKIHKKATDHNTLECLWESCWTEFAGRDSTTHGAITRRTPYSFDFESDWRHHIQRRHIRPLSWELGDGPASGLSDAYDSEAFLSDAQGRQVTPRITVNLERLESDNSSSQVAAQAPRGRGRPPKVTPEQEARDAQSRLVLQKKRIGGPGMDRGGARLVNDKRRRGLQSLIPTDEELVDAED